MSDDVPGEWKTAHEIVVCARCERTIYKRRQYYAVCRDYCTRCANEIWGVSTRTDRAKKRQLPT